MREVFINNRSSIMHAYVRSVAPVAYQVILEPGIGQFLSRVRIPPSAYLLSKFVGTFSCAHIDLRKARERELATLDEKSTSGGIAEPYPR